jgi:SAM-dependent methyltransferase
MGVDLSETFVAKGRDAAQREGVRVEFVVSGIRSLPYRGVYDLVTWIESSFFDADIIRSIERYLTDGGRLIFDVRNPEHPRSRSRGGNWRTWREDGGIFYLERHETDKGTGSREDVWITIDPQRRLIEEKVNSIPHVWSLDEKLEALRVAGFETVELRTLDGQVFAGGPEPYWLWVVAAR